MHQYYNSEYATSSSTLRLEPTPPRRLPSVPASSRASLSPSVVESRRSSRPLPKIPRALTCKLCQAVITSHNVLLPLSQVCLDFYLSRTGCVLIIFLHPSSHRTRDRFADSLVKLRYSPKRTFHRAPSVSPQNLTPLPDITLRSASRVCSL
jgi:hypothetical protein